MAPSYDYTYITRTQEHLSQQKKYEIKRNSKTKTKSEEILQQLLPDSFTTHEASFSQNNFFL